MRCPRCSSENLSVVDSRGDDAAIRRRRECLDCSTRFTTFERIEVSMPHVVKKDGSREPYSRDKLRAGMVRSCEKRPVSMEIIDEAVERIERQVAEQFTREIPSLELGEFVINALKKIDKIAYVRFASVYREFSDISQFVDTLESLKERKTTRKSKVTAKRIVSKSPSAS